MPVKPSKPTQTRIHLILLAAESAVLEVMPLTGVSESEIFSDSVDSLELHDVKV